MTPPPAEGDLILRQWHSVIDKRTTIVCLDAAGQTAKADAPFHLLNGDVMNPPAHAHCRSMVVPWMSGFSSKVKAEANAELQSRPVKQREGRMPPRSAGEVRPSMQARPPGPEPWQLTNAEREAEKIASEVVQKRIVRPALTAEEQQVLDGYRFVDFRRVNGELRAGAASPEVMERARHLDAMIGRTEVREPVSVFRGVDPNAVDLKALRIGDEIVDNGYVSTSMLEQKTAAFARGEDLVYEIRLQAGQRGLITQPGDISEIEVLLPRELTYRVVDVVQHAVPPFDRMMTNVVLEIV